MKYLLLISLIYLQSCSFNKLFLLPTKINALTNTAIIVNPNNNDTTFIHFKGENHQPVFIKNNKDTFAFDFNIESVNFTSKNGNTLNGWFLTPNKVKASITLLHFHGNAGCVYSQFGALKPLINQGFQVFVFDYSGFGYSQGKATRKNVLVDANSALDYVKQRNDVKNTPLVIYGQSLGGHVSAVVASNRQSEIDGLVIEGAFSSHKDIAATMAGFVGRIFVKEMYSAYKSIENYKKPLLVIHSTEDEIIPISHGKKIFEHANMPKSFFEIKKPHIQGTRYYSIEISERIKNMLISVE